MEATNKKKINEGVLGDSRKRSLRVATASSPNLTFKASLSKIPMDVGKDSVELGCDQARNSL